MASFACLTEYAWRLQHNFPVQRLTRTPSMQLAYELYKQQHPDLAAHVKSQYLQQANHALVPNKFPLDLAPNLSQHVLWVQDIALLNIDMYVKRHFAPKRVVIFENPTDWKSIPSITHYHVIVEEFVAKL